MRSEIDLGGSGLQMAAKAALRRKKLTLSIALTAFMACALLVLTAKPRYTAETFILMDSSLATGLSQPSLQSTESQRLRGEIEILGSDEIARQVIRELQLWQEEEFRASDSMIARVMDRLRSAIAALRSLLQDSRREAGTGSDKADQFYAEVEGVLGAYRSASAISSDGRSLAARVLFTAEDPELAARIANTHAAMYLKNQVNRRAETKRSTAEWLEADLARRATEMKLAEAALQNFQPGSNLRALEALAAGKRKIYETVLNRYNLAVSEEANTFPDAKIISSAEPPNVPSSPKTALWLLVGLGLSTGLGVMSAVIAEHWSRRSDLYEDLAQEIGVDFLGVVPPENLSGDATRQLDSFLRRERIRNIRNQLLLANQRCTTLAVSSALPGEEKSFVAVSLAKSFGSAGLATLLIDADVHCPAATKMLDLQDFDYGFSDVVSRTVTPDVAIKLAGTIFVLPSKKAGIDANTDFVSSQLSSLLEKMQAKFDVIIIDGPPLLAASSALVITSAADQTVVVAGAAQDKIAELKMAVEALQKRDIRTAGLVVVGVDRSGKRLLSKLALSPYVHDLPLTKGASDRGAAAASKRHDNHEEPAAFREPEAGDNKISSVHLLPTKSRIG